MQRGVGLLRDEAVGLLLGPAAGEDGYDGGAAEDLGGRVALEAVGVEGLAEEVGEEEGLVGAEEAGGRDEGLSVVVVEVRPVAEVGPGESLFAVWRSCVSAGSWGGGGGSRRAPP